MKIGKSNKNYANHTKKTVKNCQKQGLTQLTMVKLHKDRPDAGGFHKMDIKVVHDGVHYSTCPADGVNCDQVLRDCRGHSVYLWTLSDAVL